MNGRVNILEPDTNKLFSLYDKIGCDSKVTEYRNPLNGNWHENKVSELFFSSKNIQILQNGIIQGVLQGSNGLYNIGPQCTDTLKIIMRSIYLSSAKNLPSNYHKQVDELNRLVLGYSVPQVLGEAKGYMHYLKDVSTLPTPLDLPVMTFGGDNPDSVLEQKIGF